MRNEEKNIKSTLTFTHVMLTTCLMLIVFVHFVFEDKSENEKVCSFIYSHMKVIFERNFK